MKCPSELPAALAVLLMAALAPDPIPAQPIPVEQIFTEHTPLGIPRGTPGENGLIVRDLYVLSNNGQTRFADWVAYRLTPEETYGSLDLEREWRADPWLAEDETLEPDGPAGPDDYDGAYAQHRYDRGHLVPLGSFVGSESASSLNFYSNIVPQTIPLNRGPWKQLEDLVRELVVRHQEVWVMAGTLYDGEPMPLWDGAIEIARIPTAFWKTVHVAGAGGPTVAAFLMPQRAVTSRSPWDYSVSIDEIESRTGLDLFWKLDDTVESVLEAGVADPADWLQPER